MQKQFFFSLSIFLVTYIISPFSQAQGTIPIGKKSFVGALEFLPNGILADDFSRVKMAFPNDKDPLLNPERWYGNGNDQIKGIVEDAALFFEWWTNFDKPIERYKFEWINSGYFDIKYFDYTGSKVEKRISRSMLVFYPNLLQRFENLKPLDISFEITFQLADLSGEFNTSNTISLTRKLGKNEVFCTTSESKQNWTSPGFVNGNWEQFLGISNQSEELKQALIAEVKSGKSLIINSFKITEINWDLKEFRAIVENYDAYEAFKNGILNAGNSDNLIHDSKTLEKKRIDDLATSLKEKELWEAAFNAQVSERNELREKELYQAAIDSKNKDLLELYKQIMSSTELKRIQEINDEIEKHNNPSAFLGLSIESNDLKEFNYLLQLGAKLDWKNQDEKSLIQLCIENNADQILPRLLELNTDLERANAEGNTPLMQAVKYNRLKFVSLLLEKGANPLALNGSNSKSAFQYSLENNQYQIGEVLIQKGANPNENLNFENGIMSPLHFTISLHDSTNFAKYLLRNGAKIDSLSPTGLSPLMLAVNLIKTEFVNYLLSNGASINKRGKDQKTALHLAVEKQNVALSAYLIQRGGADKNAKDASGKTALKIAAPFKNDTLNLILKNFTSLINPKSKPEFHEQQYILGLERYSLNSLVKAVKHRRNKRLIISASMFLTVAALIQVKLKMPKPPETKFQTFYPFIMGGVGAPALVIAFFELGGTNNKSNAAYQQAKERINEIDVELKKLGM